MHNKNNKLYMVKLLEILKMKGRLYLNTDY